MARANSKNKRSVKENSNTSEGGKKKKIGWDSQKGETRSAANSGNPALRKK